MMVGYSHRVCYTTLVTNLNAHQFAIEIARIANDHKSEDVVGLDLREISKVMDYTVIATGSSDRQMRAVADMIVEYGKKVGQKPYGKCGFEGGTWIVIDFVDVVFHIFAKPYRDYYDLELLWGDAPHINWLRSESA